ncbi:hypothetical protein [Salipaludibacillus agaradhaerens]|uniref:Uncharacterized protein n=1 Tax=Salipaludibacillus agaradhaerens TaxID=76935 RepID=A0A9Q4FYL3_SALAG|nr:hypothetical protein [Salipaludibacillus agaradhaerens]MCR6095853.1 hypothetical protein [Salipaludibacillus agaradhaerens]
MSIKSSLYKLLRISNDINAVKRGTIGKRVARRATGKITGRAIQKLFK